MASTSGLCPADRLERRGDLVPRPLPEIGMCMVYRPQPARIVTLNPSAWMLLQACNGATVAEIERDFAVARSRRSTVMSADDVRRGLQSLVDLSLAQVCAAANGGIPDKEK
jgi:hypothetical protein